MKRILLVVMTALMLTPAWADVEINEQTFPDANFRNIVSSMTIDKDRSGTLSDDEIASVTSLNVANRSITDLAGIQYFTALTELKCYGCNFTALNLSNNKALTSVSCYNNNLNVEAMTSFIASLPTVSEGQLYVKLISANSEHNLCTTEHVAAAKDKGWTVYDSNKNEYAGLTVLCSIDETNFPDETFRTYVASSSVDRNQDAILTDEETSPVTSTFGGSYLTGKNIASLKGIEYFTAMKQLYCYNNQLTTLDLSQNKALTRIECYGNQIQGEGMDAFVACLPTVEEGSIYLINNENEGNACSREHIREMNGKGWSVLQKDLQKEGQPSYWQEMSGLEPVEINETNFPDEALRTELSKKTYDKDGDGVLSGNELSTKKEIRLNYLKTLSDLTGLEHFVNLKTLHIYQGALTAIDTRGLVNLESLEISRVSSLTSVDVSKNEKLTRLKIYDAANISSLSLTPTIKTLDLDKTPLIKELNVKPLTDLRLLTLGGLGIVDLDISGLKSLTQLSIGSGDGLSTLTPLKSLIISDCSSLTSIRCSCQSIETLEIDGLDALEKMAVWRCLYLTTLKVKNCAKLRELECDCRPNGVARGGGSLATLELENCPKLYLLDCENNVLREVNLDKVTGLRNLDFDDNQLMELDLSKLDATADVGYANYYFDLNEKPSVIAVKLSKTQVGLNIPDRFNVKSVSNLRAVGKSQAASEVTIDGIRYFVFYNDADAANNLIKADNYYDYDTMLPEEAKAKLADRESEIMHVTLDVTGVTKHPAFIKLASTEVVKGVYGSAAPASPGIIRSQDYDGKLTYKSSNEKVVTVDADGKLTIVGAGKATITISGAETDYRLAPEDISYEVEIDKAKVTFAYAEAKQEMIILDEVPENKLDIGVYDGTVTYKSSDAKIATVDADGKVTVVAAGVVAITASGAETANCYEATPASYELTIKKKTCTLTLSAAEVSGVYGGTATAPEVTKGNGYDGTLEYESGDKNVVTVSDEGVLTIVGAGETIVTVSGPETAYCYAPASVSYTVKIAKADVAFSFAEESQEMFFKREIPANELDKGVYDGTVVYAINNSDIAEFDADGQLIVKAVGIVTITASGVETTNCNKPTAASYTLTINKLPGDVNEDGEVNETDFELVADCIMSGGYDKKYDLNDDNKVNAADLVELANMAKIK